MYNQFIENVKNPFKLHWQAFINNEITLHQLQLVTFAWVIKNEHLYRERPLPTEPIQNPKTSVEDFKRVMKAWHLRCGSMEMEIISSEKWLMRAKKFFLDSKNKIEEGIALFEKYKEPEKVPF